MIAETNHREIIRSNNFEETQFKILGTGKVMEILYSKIYTNKPLSVLRETASNAKDANVEAGKVDIPIEIILPSYLEPTLRIKDCGNSMSHETVMTLYATYGLSTKSESNSYIGAYGIGKFSPFCYCSSFQLICVINKIKRIYNMYLDESSIGKIALLSESETEESNGTEVLIPIKGEDIDTFVNTAESLFQFWLPTPVIKGNSDYHPPVTEYIIKGNNWAFIKNDDYYRTSYCIMGGVPYKLSKESIKNLSTEHYRILEKAVLLYANIGDVNVNAGREELEYTDKTINFVKSRLDVIYTEAKSQIENKLKTVTSEYEAREMYYDYFGNLGKLASVFSEILKSCNYQLEYNNHKIIDYRFDVSNHSVERYQFSLVTSWRSDKGYKLQTNYLKQIDIFGNQPVKNPINNNVEKFLYYVETDDKGIWKSHTKNKIAALVRHYLSVQLNKKIYDENVTVLIFKEKQDYDTLISNFGIPQGIFKEISTVIIPPPKAPKVKSARVSYKTARTEIADKYEGGVWKYSSVDIKTVEGYYVTRWYSNYYLNYNKDSLVNNEHLFNNSITFLNDIDKLPDNLYAFTPKVIEKLNKKKWLPLESYVKIYLEDYNEKNNTVDIIPISELSLTSEAIKLLEFIQEKKFKVNKDYILNKVLKKLCDKANEFTDYRNLNTYFQFKLKEYSCRRIELLSKVINKETEKYSLLERNNFYAHSSDLEKDWLIYLHAKYEDMKTKIKKQKVLTAETQTVNVDF